MVNLIIEAWRRGTIYENRENKSKNDAFVFQQLTWPDK